MRVATIDDDNDVRKRTMRNFLPRESFPLIHNKLGSGGNLCNVTLQDSHYKKKIMSLESFILKSQRMQAKHPQ